MKERDARIGSETAETIGQRLKRLRLERGFSQRELAAPGVSYAYISRIEAGTRQPSVKALRKLAAKLGVTASYLETGSQLEPSGALELRLTDLELAVRLGERDGAAEQLERVLHDALTAGDHYAARRARVALALLAKEEADYTRAIELLEAAVEGEPFSPAERVELYAELGHAYAAAGKPELAVSLFERCIGAVRERGGAAELEARFATALSYALSDTGDFARAEQVVREALRRVGNSADNYMRVKLYWSMARLAHAENRPTLALANARKAIALLEATEDTANLARAHLLAASIMITRGEADAADTQLDDAERMLGGAPSLGDTAMLRVKRAQVAALRGDGAGASERAREALAAIGDDLPQERGTAYFALAEGLALTGAVDEAADAFRRAAELLEGQHRWREATQALRAWARMLRDAGREQQALDVLDRATELGLRTAPADAVRS